MWWPTDNWSTTTGISFIAVLPLSILGTCLKQQEREKGLKKTVSLDSFENTGNSGPRRLPGKSNSNTASSDSVSGQRLDGNPNKELKTGQNTKSTSNENASSQPSDSNLCKKGRNSKGQMNIKVEKVNHQSGLHHQSANMENLNKRRRKSRGRKHKGKKMKSRQSSARKHGKRSMDQACSSPGLDDSEKEFCVKNIPIGLIDWDLFHIFRKYGIVHNVKIPTKQNFSNSKYGFVVMEDFNGAEEVRRQLKNGKFLTTENGIQLQVVSVHHGDAQQRSRPDNCESGTRPPLKDLQNPAPAVPNKNRIAEKHTPQKVHQPLNPVKCFSQDLPLRIPVKVRVVGSPRPCESAKEDFVFHVIPIDQKLGDEYTVLQREMNKYCLTSPNLLEAPKIGEYAIYGRASIAYRALCNSDKTMYLVDTGETAPTNCSQLWEMLPAFARLPSLVIPCGIADITWKNPSTTTFNNYRNALSQWSRSYTSGLTATACGFSGLKNLVNLDATSGDVVDDFATCITAKGVCTRLSREHHIYSREDVLNAKKSLEGKDYSPLINYNENIAEIITGMQAVAVA
ncbi:hypothetical protein Y032_0363g3528 [Ancylostoma ceylanicum]|nr:hypothetical protein Y032_0363g3528 [Ancylostoma ceylanicum]